MAVMFTLPLSQEITKAEVSDTESLFHAFENHIVQILDFRKKKEKKKEKEKGTSKKL